MTEETTAAQGIPAEPMNSIGGWMSKLGSLDEQPETTTPPAQEAIKETAPPATAQADKPSEDTAKPAAETTAKDKADTTTTAKEDDDGAEKWPRSGADWEKFKKKRAEKEAALQAQVKEREAKIAEYEAKVKELSEATAKIPEVDPETKAEVERLRKINEEYSKIVAMNEITSHPDFKAKFDAPLEKQRERLKQYIGEEKASQLAIIQSLPEGEIKAQRKQEFLAELTPYESGQLAIIESRIEEINEGRAQAIENARIHREKLHAEQKTKAEQSMVENQKIFKSVVKQAQDAAEGNPLFQLRDGDEKWNAGVKQRIALAEKVLFGDAAMLPNEVMKYGLNAVAYPALLESYQASLGEIETLKEQVKSLSAAQPTAASGGNPPAASAPTPKPSRDMNPFDLAGRFAKEMNRAMYAEQ